MQPLLQIREGVNDPILIFYGTSGARERGFQRHKILSELIRAYIHEVAAEKRPVSPAEFKQWKEEILLGDRVRQGHSRLGRDPEFRKQTGIDRKSTRLNSSH